jgi:hypothetical protein
MAGRPERVAVDEGQGCIHAIVVKDGPAGFSREYPVPVTTEL